MLYFCPSWPIIYEYWLHHPLSADLSDTMGLSLCAQYSRWVEINPLLLVLNFYTIDIPYLMYVTWYVVSLLLVRMLICCDISSATFEYYCSSACRHGIWGRPFAKLARTLKTPCAWGCLRRENWQPIDGVLGNFYQATYYVLLVSLCSAVYLEPLPIFLTLNKNVQVNLQRYVF